MQLTPRPAGNGAAMRIAAILVAAGSGSRFGAETPKQFLPLAGKPVIRHAAEALAAHVDTAAAGRRRGGDRGGARRVCRTCRRCRAAPRARTACAPGSRRWRAQAPDVVLVHDAARPLIPPGTIPALLAALEHAPGAIPAVPVADTLKRVADGLITATVPRDGLFRAQTPQAFRFPMLLAAHRAGRRRGATDDASLLEAVGRAGGDRRRLRGQHQADLCRGPAPAGARHDRPA